MITRPRLRSLPYPLPWIRSTRSIHRTAATPPATLRLSRSDHSGALRLNIPGCQPSATFLLPFATSIEHLRQDIAEEFPHECCRVLIPGQDVDDGWQMTVAGALMSDGVRIQVGDHEYRVEREGLRMDLRREQAFHARLEARLAELDAQSERVAKLVASRKNLIEYGGSVFMLAQLGSVMFLTSALGWDVMEPVTYMMALSTAILASGYYCYIGQELTYENMGAGLGDMLRRRYRRRLGMDESERVALRSRLGTLKLAYEPIFAASDKKPEFERVPSGCPSSKS